MRLLAVLLLFSLSAFAAGPLHRSIPEKPYPNSRFATVDSIRIHYRTWNDSLAGAKGKVLLIHGFVGSTFCWRNNSDSLAAAGYRVVAVDLPGWGYSGRDPNLNQSQSNRARILWELLDQIDGGDTSKWHIIGHSMGGGTAEAVALTRPGRTRSLVIVAGMVFLSNNNVNITVVGLVNHPVYKKLLLSYAENNYLTFNNIRRQLKGTYGFLPDTATTMGYLEPLLVEGTAGTVVNLIGNSREICDLDAKNLSGMPVLLIWGKKDRTIRLSTGKTLKRYLPSVELEVIPHVRHMPMETEPALFNRMVTEFLGRNRN